LPPHFRKELSSQIIRGPKIPGQVTPPIGPELSIGPPREEYLTEYHQNMRLQNWGMANMRSGRTERVPPDEIWKG
jgi:hypothetical protein